jgi:hypothetical protein
MTVSVWDPAPLPAWSPVRRRLREDPEVLTALGDALRAHPQTAGHLEGLAEFKPARLSYSTWFAGTWQPDGVEVLVKLNVTAVERFWMTTVSAGTTGVVAPVLAADRALGDVDVPWLAMERLPHRWEPSWGKDGHTALLVAAARFQEFASGVQGGPVNEDSVRTIWRMAVGGRDLCPDAEALIRNLPRDWAYVARVAPPEVLFGDLHFGNAAFRTPPPDPQAVLFDPIPRRQPWPYEPAYLEVMSGGSALVREMAAIRRKQGRPTCEPDEVDRVAALYCGWMALTAWGIQPGRRDDRARRERLTTYVRNAARLKFKR